MTPTATALLFALLAAAPAPPEELPLASITPGAVRVSAAAPLPANCPPALLVDERPARGCPAAATEVEICVSRGTRQYRHTAHVTKLSVCYAYGVSKADCPKFEDDHLVPLTLGGADERPNHWAQPWGSEWDAARKDWLEVELRRLVCDRHVLTLPRAQRCIAEEWTLCYAQAKWGDYAGMGR